MEFWNQVINTALLGTGKNQRPISNLPEPLEALAVHLANDHETDREEQYLKLAATASIYRKCGTEPLRTELSDFTSAEEEPLAYCTPAMLKVLNSALFEGCMPLVFMCLRLCKQKQRIVEPELLPQLLDIAQGYENNRTLVMDCCGKRGEWLCSFNEKWAKIIPEPEEEIWQTGTVGQRKILLQQIRHRDPELGRTWLQQTWDQETAATRTELIGAMEINAGAGDIPWLETLLQEKSKKIKDEAIRLLKLIPGSVIVELAWQAAGRAVTLKKEKGFFGIGAKTKIEIQLPLAIPEQLWQMGIEKQSNDNNYTDDEYQLFQLLKYIPPHYWEQHFSEKPEQVIAHFVKASETDKYTGAIAMQVIKSKNAEWAMHIANSGRLYFIEIVNLLPEEKREPFLLKDFGQHQQKMVEYAQNFAGQWSEALTKAVFNITARSPYLYGKSYYKEHIERIPVAAIDWLNEIQPEDKYAAMNWGTCKDYIIRLNEIKQNIEHAFKNA